MPRLPRLAIVATHPVQYYAPWFAHLARHLHAKLKVFYLWDFGVVPQRDPGFDLTLEWDVDLLAGYLHRFVPNLAGDPGTHHFRGLDNPSLVRELTEWNPDAVLLFGYRYLSHLRVILSRRLRAVPLLFRGDSHLLAEPLRARPFKRLALRSLFHRFAAFLPVGRANVDYFLQHGITPERLFVAPHCVDNARFSDPANEKPGLAWRRELDIPDSDRVILFAGKFEPKKRPDLLLRAFLKAASRDATLLFTGSGPMESLLRRMTAGRCSVRFAGFQNQQAMPRVHAAADLLVLPSEGPGETWGLVVNEACCAGRAVIVSDHVGCHGDLVRHRENGLVFRAGSVASLHKVLADALSDDARLRSWGAASRRLVREFSFERATEGLQRALNFALEKRN